MTKQNFLLDLTMLIGESFARYVAAQAKAPKGGKPAYVRPVCMKDYFNDECIPSSLDYTPSEDWIAVSYFNDKYRITFYGTDDFDFTVSDKDYRNCVDMFLYYFWNTFRA